MTIQEYRLIVKRFGVDFGYYDIPAFIRKRDERRAGVEYHFPEAPLPDKYQEGVDNQLTSRA